MTRKLSGQVIEAYIYCVTKFHLLLHGIKGEKSDYDNMCADLREKTRAHANKTLLAANSKSRKGVDGVHAHARSNGITETLFEDDTYCVKIEYAHIPTITAGDNSQEIFPMLILNQYVKHSKHIFALTLHGMLLEKLFNTNIDKVLLWIGERPPKPVVLDSESKAFENWQESLLKARLLVSEPPLRLKEYCSVCEFQRRCRDRATREGNLSFLRGMTENAIAKYNSKCLSEDNLNHLNQL